MNKALQELKQQIVRILREEFFGGKTQEEFKKNKLIRCSLEAK